MDQFLNLLKSLFEPIVIFIILVFLLLINAWIFNTIKIVKAYGTVLKNIVSIFIVLIGLLFFIFSFPVDKTLKGEILSFLAIILSAGIALSSTTILGNLIAGIMNNSMKRFRNGDLIKIGELQGRVIKKSIFHTEIQLEDSNYITIPNLYIATNPVKLTRKTDTVISTTISLGYDISRTKIEKSLKEAAFLSGLTNPYVYITSLGDYSVVYKIHGFLDDSSKYFSSISLLNANVMNVLHQKKIEIVSPTFMNQRNVTDKEFIPKEILKNEISKKEQLPENLVFDEAIKSGEIQEKKDQKKLLEEKKEDLKKDD